MDTNGKEAVAAIARDLAALGVRRGGVLLVHSSLKSMGRVAGGPETVIQGLLEALGPAGTLLLPALSYVFVGPKQPVFDVRETRSCVGAIPEYFRRRPGTRRSVHPTHSVCGVGARAEELLGKHYLDETPAGANSPFRRLPAVEGQVLMLGCGLEPNTSMHSIEELVEPPYLYGANGVEFECVMEDGQRVKRMHRVHAFVRTAQRYERLGELMGTGMQTGAVLAATAHLIEAARMWDVAHARMKEYPLYFVDRT